MQKIDCSVNICSHNNNGVCYANRVNIGNSGAKIESDTCCGSFLNQSTYGTLTNNTNDCDYCTCLICKVNTCEYNCNNLCNLSNIKITGNNPITYTETNCSSFCLKN